MLAQFRGGTVVFGGFYRVEVDFKYGGIFGKAVHIMVKK